MKVICSMVVSVDGYIADETGKSVSTLVDWKEFRKRANQYNNFVVGRHTFDKGGLDDVECEFKVVVSTKPIEDPAFIQANSPEQAVAMLEGKVDTLFLVGGGTVNTAFATAGLINELVITVQPKLVGKGTRLFSDELDIKLRLSTLENLENGRLRLSYEV